MLLIIDNYDSFTYNLVQAFGLLGAKVEVARNDAVTVDQIEALAPARICISPGPGSPKDAGISVEAVRRFAGRADLLGVCLGHQCIAAAYGGRVVHAPRVMHGKTSDVFHSGAPLFEGVPSPMTAARYHSLVVSPSGLPPALRVTAATEDGTIMALRHREHRLAGVQFHPESFLTEHGLRLMKNFLEGKL
jgi:anthranilate synthase component 2